MKPRSLILACPILMLGGSLFLVRQPAARGRASLPTRFTLHVLHQKTGRSDKAFKSSPARLSAESSFY